MKKITTIGLLLFVTSFLSAQKIDDIINVTEVKRIETILAADDMQGRKVFTPGLEKAGAFIADEFKKAGLQTMPGSKNFMQEFAIVQPKFLGLTGKYNDIPVNEKNVFVITTQAHLVVTEKSGYEKAYIKQGDNFFQKAAELIAEDKNKIILVDTSFAKNFARLGFFKRSLFASDASQLFILTDAEPLTYSFDARHELKESKLANVVGVLPGKSKKEELVIFSGHYDHLGIGKPNENQDSIFNGANDDAAGITAVILLAKYFAQQKNNERTLVFAAFTAEEAGGFGSRYFSKQFNPANVMAMFNVEMIGTESKWGTNSAYITGYEKSDMGKLLQKNLTGTPFTFYPDPYPAQNLFYRSDNATLARLGVPAHTISTSKMDSEKYYHTQEDELETLDLKNMTEIIKAIAFSSRTIISGKDTPSRVDTSSLEGNK
jgi:hypothetical protein